MRRLLTILTSSILIITTTIFANPADETSCTNVMCNVDITSSNGGVTITGLTNDANAKLFDANIQVAWNGCNPWQGNPCTGNETVSGLVTGATYFLSVQSSVCNEWMPIVIQGSGNNATCSDNIQNQGETGVDCGGPCPACPTSSTFNITPTDGGAIVTGLQATENAKIFTADYTQELWRCNPWEGNPCSNIETVTGLTNGVEYVLRSTGGGTVRNRTFTPTAGGGGGCPDTDNDDICDAEDCSPTNPNLPTVPGTPCNDFNSSTTNDVIQSDGCTCQGTPTSGGCNVGVTTNNSSITITGLTNDANTKLFDSNTQVVWNGCNPWQGNPCTNSETVNGLINGATYFVSVQSNACNEWIPVTVAGGGGILPDLSIQTAGNPYFGFGGPGTVLNFTFTLTNQGNATASGNYFIRSYISPDQSLSSDDIPEGVIQTGNTPVGSFEVNGAITIPNDLPAGNYFLILRADDGNNITESNENNNIGRGTFGVNLGGGNSCNTIGVTNVAEGKNANQSSVWNMNGINGWASRAVDGNTNGNFSNGSVAATNAQNRAWWQVDLGALYDVTSIQVYNRNEGSERLNNFYVLTSTTPFSGSNLADARANAEQERQFIGTAGLPSFWDFPGGLVRYVRIHRASFGHVTLAEVRVNGCLAGMPEGDGAVEGLSIPLDTSSTFSVNNIFPNPTSGEVIGQIESTYEGKVTIQVVNLLGQLKLLDVIDVEVGANSVIWDFGGLDNGMYHVIFRDGDKMVTEKLVISK